MRIQIFISEAFNAKGITVDVSMAESDFFDGWYDGLSIRSVCDFMDRSLQSLI
jgi:hypothetical protein